MVYMTLFWPFGMFHLGLTYVSIWIHIDILISHLMCNIDMYDKSLCLQHGHWVTVRPIKGHLTPKMNITFSVRIGGWISFYATIFLKKPVFSEKTEKLFWEHIWQFFGERRHLVLKINITFFYHKWGTKYFIIKQFFRKNCIFWENGKKLFLKPKSLLKGTGRLATKMNITFFNGKWVFKYFLI